MTENPDVLMDMNSNEANVFHFSAMYGNCNVIESVFNFSPSIGEKRKFFLTNHLFIILTRYLDSFTIYFDLVEIKR